MSEPSRKPLEFDVGLLTGTREIDDQHRQIFRFAEVLLTSLRGSAEPAVVQAAIDRLLEYTDAHFSAEEEEMKRLSYPRRAEHHDAHVLFRRELDILRKDFTASRNARSAGIRLEFLIVDWFAGHIHHLDRDLATFLQGQRAGSRIRDIPPTGAPVRPLTERDPSNPKARPH